LARQLPVKYLGDSQLCPAFPQADARGGGVGQDVSSDRLLGVGLEAAGTTGDKRVYVKHR